MFLCCFSLFNNQLEAQEPHNSGAKGQTGITGTVKDYYTNTPLVGTNLKIGTFKTKTDSKGTFILSENFKAKKLIITHQGYRDTIITISSTSVNLEIKLKPSQNQIQEVEVVSTGYQEIPRDRATGSFAFVDSKTIQRYPGMSLLSRLNGVTNGLLLDRNTGNPDGLSVRGRSTLFSSTRPLIVVDNFPYEGDLDNINPNDIQSVTVLKDATAASIWGVRSANGVIVVTTKKARDKFNADFSSTFSISNRPDVFYQKQMSSAELVEVEKFLFDKGEYNGDITLGYQDISPVVEILQKVRSGNLSQKSAHELLEEFARTDNRSDVLEYFYRPKLEHQQYLGISSSSNSVNTRVSIGYDESLKEAVAANQKRLNLRVSSQWKGLSDRLGAQMNLWYSGNKNANGNARGGSPKFPYEHLADQNGEPLEVSGSGTLRKSYTDTAGSGYLLDWKYRPLEELRGGWNRYSNDNHLMRYELGANGRIYRSFNLKLNYLSSIGSDDWSTLFDQNSFFVRNMVNQFSSIDHAIGIVNRPVPLGAILDRGTVRSVSSYGKVQLDWNESFGKDHNLSGLLGAEWRQDRTNIDNPGYLYGYDPDLESYSEVDIFSFFPIFHNGDYRRIERYGTRRRQVDNNRSWFGLFSYTFRDNLTVTASARKDASNIFGVSANQKGVPLWSVGTSYSFQKLLGWEALDRLKARLTYGYNGNVDKSTTAFLTSKLYQNRNLWGSPSDLITNPPNSSLRWERVSNLNLGIDFQALSGKVGGSVEFYLKRGKDLMGNSPIAPQTGKTEFYGNVAQTSTRGLDIQLWFDWLKGSEIGFRTDFIFNHNKDRIDRYYTPLLTNTDIISASGIFPIVGNPINSLVLYRSAGLDQKGDPLGYLNGERSDDYSALINGIDRDAIQVMGSMVPTQFGSLRNTFSYRGFEFSFLVFYRFGNYLRRANSMNSFQLIGGNYKFSDYHLRWQNPGDEATTQVPRFVYPGDINREEFYQYSTALAYSGSLVRLQDAKLAYSLKPFSTHTQTDLQLFMHAGNLGILWRKNKEGIDPEVGFGIPSPLELTFGVKLNY